MRSSLRLSPCGCVTKPDKWGLDKKAILTDNGGNLIWRFLRTFGENMKYSKVPTKEELAKLFSEDKYRI